MATRYRGTYTVQGGGGSGGGEYRGVGGSSRASCRVNLSSLQAQVETTTRKEGKLRTGKAIVIDRVGVL